MIIPGSLHPMFMAAGPPQVPSITYTKSATLLDNLGSNQYFVISNYNRATMVFEGVLSATVGSSTPGDTTGRILYANADSGIPTIQSFGYPNALGTGLYGETTTPPGWFLLASFSNTSMYRWNIDNVEEYVNQSSNASMNVWCNQEQAMFGTFYTGVTRLAKFHSFNWAAHTMAVDTTTYSTAGGQVHEIFQNGALVDGRIYYAIDAANSPAGGWGWVNALTGAHTEVVNAAQFFGRGLVCASSYTGANPFIVVQSGATGEANVVQFWDTSNTLIGTITLPESSTGYGWSQYLTHDRVNNYVWVNYGGTQIYVLDANTYSIRDVYTSSDLPAGSTVLCGPVGSPSGGVYAINGSGGNYQNLYKLG